MVTLPQHDLAEFLDRLPAPIYRSTPEGRIVSANPALAEMLGYTLDRLLAIDVIDLYVNPEERDLILERRANSTDLEPRELLFRRADGSTIWVRVVTRAVVDEDGRPIHFDGVLEDITARKEAEAALATSEALFRGAFEDAPQGLVILSPDLWPLQVNRSLCEILRMSEDEILATPCFEQIHPGDRATAKAQHDAIGSGHNDRYTAERRLLRGDGTYASVLVATSAVRDAAGTIEVLICQIFDIADRRAAEDALREKEAENRLLIDAIPDMLIRMDREGVHKSWRPARNFPPPMPAEEFIGRNIRDVLPAQADLILAAIEAAITSGQPQKIEFSVEIHDKPSDFSATFTPLGDDEALVIVRDITERKQAQERLEALVRSKDELIASVSHELRTPLTSIVGLASELRDRSDEFTEEERAELMGLVADQGKEMSDLVNDLLVAARADVGMVRIEPELIDLREQVDGVLEAMGGAEISFTPNGAVLAWADPFRVRQVIRNLLTNAIRYGASPIEVCLDQHERRAIVEVIDHGPGVPKPERERIFDPYERLHASGGLPTSLGLGLTLSRQLARIMGGDLIYCPRDGIPCFELTLPVSADG